MTPRVLAQRAFGDVDQGDICARSAVVVGAADPAAGVDRHALVRRRKNNPLIPVPTRSRLIGSGTCDSETASTSRWVPTKLLNSKADQRQLGTSPGQPATIAPPRANAPPRDALSLRLPQRSGRTPGCLPRSRWTRLAESRSSLHSRDRYTPTRSSTVTGSASRERWDLWQRRPSGSTAGAPGGKFSSRAPTPLFGVTPTNPIAFTIVTLLLVPWRWSRRGPPAAPHGSTPGPRCGRSSRQRPPPRPYVLACPTRVADPVRGTPPRNRSLVIRPDTSSGYNR